ncbi:dipeptidyl aminopeptidase/acylaminoacyl peptidase [Pseudoduganella flava]|uniref:Dipeptidyl aminopeptidase/acylaminoacyl peptidase n=1 Tax=Pseudoduganella flava TaxID=871742 RepID=A0A562PWM7_9BURK|nr:alpha/beta fold hydrolase [Pseudoduganella flava]QGZ39880.1 prolyl oligopeptidase family serine peptidase [Pseudoduganella flava]TWI48809.1 dipeptidyl aminopeptidase/acylaminoacyl peptidase [Pseudoduganella flava]
MTKYLRFLLLSLSFAAAVVHAAPPVEQFFAEPKLADPVLSPGGRYVAMKVAMNGARAKLVVFEPGANRPPAIVAHFPDLDINVVQWVNEQRLLFNTVDRSVGQGDRTLAAGLFAVDADGANPRQLADVHGAVPVTGSRVRPTMLDWNHFILEERGPQDSNAAYMLRGELDSSRRAWSAMSLVKVDTKSASSTQVPGPGHAMKWMLDYAGQPRLAVRFEDGMTEIHILDADTGNWRKLAAFPSYGVSPGAFTPLAFGPDGTLYVKANRGDTSAVFALDVKTGKLAAEPIVNTPGFDFDGKLVFGRGKLLGIELRTDALGVEWIDAGMKAVQADIDKLLPATVNVITVPARATTQNVLVTAYSDRFPKAYYVYDMATKQAVKLGDTQPGIEPKQMGTQQWVQYKARDGMTIPALLTLPPGRPAQKLPLVVLVHGGPYVRGNSWEWNPQSQFLATRGYAVLEPEFRGSMGFGVKHFKAGFRQWGLAMQDDVTDGARWLIGRGTVDANRVCIAGASYGGYAALMGVAREPDLFKCAIDWVGVTDLNLLYSAGWNFASDASDDWKRYGLPQLVGDREKDAAQLQATSPLYLADRISRPLLLAYGGVDQRVPLDHGLKFRSAVTKTNRDVEWVQYPDEGHGWSLPQNKYDFWNRVERFLDRNIGAAAQK